MAASADVAVNERLPGSRRLGLADYIAALQCERRVWLAARERAAEPESPASAWGWGRRVGEILAQRSELPEAIRALCPRAVEVPEGLPLEEALERTRALLRDPAVAAVRGAVLEREGWTGRADLLERLPEGALGLRLLAADTAPRELDLDRAALLAFLVEGSAPAVGPMQRLGDVQLWFLDRDQRRGAGELHWRSLVRRRDVTGDVRLLLGDVPAALARAAQLIQGDSLPEIEPSPHCFRPLRCEYWERCTSALPRGALVHLPRLRAEQFHALRERGIERIAEIPDGEPLDPIQLRTREAWRANRAVLAPALAARLRELGPALAYLDFETAVPLVPLLPGSAPLEPVPAQWSLLCDAPGAELRGDEFLAAPGSDPRESFAQSLIAALADWTGPIAVYSDFESQVLERLQRWLPPLQPALGRIRAQLVDLLALLREHVAHPDFLGSYSLKRVAPVLAPEIRYSDLGAISAGAAAARVLEAWIAGSPGAREAELRAGLLAYCRRDVEALRAVHRALLELAGVAQ